MTKIATKKTAYVEVRSQPTKGKGWATGPDTYVAVQIVPEGVEKLIVLNSSVAAKRGIEIIQCGEGYSSRCKTTRSMLGAALIEADRVAANINEETCTDCDVLIVDGECPACESSAMEDY